MDAKKLEIIRKINKNIVHEDGTIDSFERQIIDLISGVYDTQFPMVLSAETDCVKYINSITKNKPLVLLPKKIIKIKEEHSLGYSFIADIEKKLKSSIIAFETLKFDSSKMVLLDENNIFGKPIIAILRDDKNIGYVAVNQIMSIYERKNFLNYFLEAYDKNCIVYKNEKTERYFNSYWSQLPKDLKYALSSSYNKGSFTKSQVEHDLKQQYYNEKYVIEDELYVMDEKVETVNAYLCVTPEIAEEIEKYTGELMDEIENVNLYANFNVRRNTLELNGTYYKENTQYEYTLEQTNEENSVLKDKLEEYCKEKEGMSCLEYVNIVREEEELKKIVREKDKDLEDLDR